MATLSENFVRLMSCNTCQELANALLQTIPPYVRASYPKSDDELNQMYKNLISSEDYFGAFVVAQLMLINALKKEDYAGSYGAVTAVLFSAIVDGTEAAQVALSLVWPVMAFCQDSPHSANAMTLAFMGTQIMQATNQLRQKGGAEMDGATAMLVFQSMSIFNILAIKKTPMMAQVDTDPLDYAMLMEQLGMKGAVKWVRENS
jgi:hypothetical protein